MPITANHPFKWQQHPGEFIILCARWYLRYPLSYEHVTELMSETRSGGGCQLHLALGATRTHPSWTNAAARFWSRSIRAIGSMRPTIKVNGEDKYLYRAPDSTGQTIDFLTTAKRDAAAAKRFLRRAIDASGNAMPG
jgi:transposase-like protein